MNLVGLQNWDIYKDLIRDAHDTFMQKIIIWKRSRGAIDIHGEDILNERFTDIELKVLLSDVAFRRKPTDLPTETGELDRDTKIIIINLRYLGELGFLNANGNFNFDSSADKFIIDGLIFKATGDNKLAQALNEELLTQIIVRRQETFTGDNNV